ncbi:hypothetical protein Tco_1283544 [Tanacetum coccineum]
MSQNKQKEKEKGVEIRNVEDTERPRPTSTRSVLTLKPLPKIDPKDKGKKRIDEEGESDTKSDDITEAERKFKMLAKDEEVARKVQEEWESEEEKKRLAEEATKVALTNEYNFIQERIMLTDFAEELQWRKERIYHWKNEQIDERQIKETMKKLKTDPGKKRLMKEGVNEEDTCKGLCFLYMTGDDKSRVLNFTQKDIEFDSVVELEDYDGVLN